ncbi:arylsulfatase A-like enzyme [Catalinimonas alkaloidigena]|uniref:arylsulfatase n=1 Tax=Catalinimonas alkaloidigena TaxID=1075417 RepID=UPI0024076933|nr:arylsulfatase [Catalinimonas alkaloidigena]MDF9798978.1 arylsulfatase A-like enzyme [Catalinimonas alkaloidigena]
MQRLSLAYFLSFSILTWSGCSSPPEEASASEANQRPNIILIMADDMGYSDLGCYGSEINTPNLDRLAAEGMRMTQFYNTAKCTETRATLLTGLYHQQTDNLNRTDNNVTLAEVLKEAGYQTIMSGKWHLGHWQEDIDTPNQRGFDHYFGFLCGAINFFTGLDYGSGVNYMRKDREVYEVPEDFYSTDAFTEYAIEEVTQASQHDQPFFLYLAHNAPHFPLQVHDAYIQKYADTYSIGWDSLRTARYQRMQEMGLIDADWALSPRDSIAPAWASLSRVQKEEEQLLMATYAGMIDRLDQQIGLLLDQLDELGIAENTLIMFMSDNGGCPFDANHAPVVAAGSAESARTYDTEWAQASNTPFRKYKQWIHEGGISSPMIIRWPEKVEANSISESPGQIVDIMPTLIEVAGTSYPEGYQGRELLPLEGVSLLPIFEGASLSREKPMYWEYRGSRAIRDGNWKLVGERGRGWELYDLAKDRSEMNNVAEQFPKRVSDMVLTYDQWGERIGGKTTVEAMEMPVNQQDRYHHISEKSEAGTE